jgi:hypothetical protein
MEGSGRGLAKVHIPAFPWKIRGKARKISGQDSWCSERELSCREYEAGLPTTRTGRSEWGLTVPLIRPNLLKPKGNYMYQLL